MNLISRRQFTVGVGLGGLMIAAPGRYSRRAVAAADHGAAGLLTDHGQDPMVTFNPSTGAVYVAWLQPGEADHDQPEATPEGQMAMSPSGQVLLARSTDGGTTFGAPVVASGSDTDVISYVGSSPLVVAGPDGDVYAVYQRNVPHEGVDFGRDILRLARSTDDGQRFAPAVDVFTDTDALEAGSYHDAIVAPDGAIYVAWLSYRQYMPENAAGDDPKTEVRIARSDDNGATFGPSILVDDSSCECCQTALAVDADGVVYLAWRDLEEQPDGGDPIRNMVISRSADRSDTWDSAAVIHDDGWRVGQCPESGPAIAVDESGKIRAAWFTGKEGGAGVFYAASEDGGRTFSSPETIASDEYFPHANVRAAIDDEGAFWVAWDDPRTEAGEIGLVHVDESGTIAQGIEQALAGRTADVAVSPAGTILTWLSEEGVQVEVVGHDEQES